MEIIIKESNGISIEEWIALVALIISLVSIIIAGLTMYYQRKHQRKSVEPIAFVSYGDYEDHIFVKISNYGIGPLLIKQISVVDGNEKKDNLIDFFNINFPVGYGWNDFTIDLKNRAIKVNDDIVLIDIVEPDLENNQDNITNWNNIKYEIRKKLEKTTVIINYTSIYKKKTYKYERELFDFGRHYQERPSEILSNSSKKEK